MWIKFGFCCLIMFCVLSLIAQKGSVSRGPFTPLSTIQDNALGAIRDDTMSVLALFERVNEECKKHVYANIDTVQFYAHKALAISHKIEYTRGTRKLYGALAWAFHTNEMQDSSKFYYNLGIIQAKATCDTLLQWLYSHRLGWVYMSESKWDSSINSFKLSMHYALDLKDTSRFQNSANQLARVYLNKGDYVTAAKQCLEIIRLAKLKKDTSNLLYSYGMLGSLYGDMELFENEMKISQAALRLVENIKDSSSRHGVYFRLSSCYLNQSKYDSAIYYARLSLPSFLKNNVLPYSWLNLAEAFYEINQIDSAVHYYNLFLGEFELATRPADPNIYLGLAKCALKTGNMQKARTYFSMAEKEVDKADFWNKKVIYKALYEYYNSMQQYEIALQYHKQFKFYEDSTINSQMAMSIGIAETEYATSLMQEQLVHLIKDKELQTILNSKQRLQRNMLYGGIGITIILAGYGFTRYRRNKTLKSKQALMNERLRISRDLHDEVGATLSGLAMYSHLAKEQVKNADALNAENSLNIMQKSAGDMVNKLSDIVWLMNPEQDTIFKLFERLEEYLRQLAATKNIQVKIELPSGMKEMHLPLEVRRNIYLFCKEAINNAVKYSHGSLIQLMVKLSGDRIEFSVGDNGIGFDEILVKRGNGLNNMKQRAEEIGAFFQMKSSSEQGTQIKLEYALNI